jgi:hypothetical protein
LDEITDTNPIMNTDCLKEHHVKECSIISENIELLKKARKKEIQECIFLEVNPNDSVYFDNKIQEEEKRLDRIKDVTWNVSRNQIIAMKIKDNQHKSLVFLCQGMSILYPLPQCFIETNTNKYRKYSVIDCLTLREILYRAKVFCDYIDVFLVNDSHGDDKSDVVGKDSPMTKQSITLFLDWRGAGGLSWDGANEDPSSLLEKTVVILQRILTNIYTKKSLFEGELTKDALDSILVDIKSLIDSSSLYLDIPSPGFTAYDSEKDQVGDSTTAKKSEMGFTT